MITDRQALAIYRSVYCVYPLDEEQERAAIEDVRAILDCPSVEDAVDVVTKGWGSTTQEDADIAAKIMLEAGQTPVWMEQPV